MKCYLSGRITGEPLYRSYFDAARRNLFEDGHVVLDPSQLPEGMEKADYMRICLSMVDSCDVVVLLNNWALSPGAAIEKKYAEYIGKEVVAYEDFVERHGLWIPLDGGGYECSECWHRSQIKADRCQVCRSLMDGFYKSAVKAAYEKPEVELIELSHEDIICTSGGWPGYGYGDDNHDHGLPPGHGGARPDKPGRPTGGAAYDE